MSEMLEIDIDDFLKRHKDDLPRDKKTELRHLLKKEYIDSIYSKIIQPYIKANYLSHWKSSIENLINERRKKKFLEELNQEQQENIQKVFASFRMYSIELRTSEKKLAIPAKVMNFKTPISSASVIRFDKNYTDEEIRFCIAHELGHIIMDNLLPEYGTPMPSEDYVELFAHFWACYIIFDKSEFYHKDDSDFKYSSFKNIDSKISKFYGSPIAKSSD